MSLTDQDLKKIQALFDAQSELFLTNFDRLNERLEKLEARVDEASSDLSEQITNLREDVEAFAQTATKNEQAIKVLTRRVRILEQKVGLRS